MIEFVCTTPPVRIAQRVVMVTMHFYLVQMSLFLRNIFFSHGGGAGNNLAPMKYCPGGKVGQIRFCVIGYPISVLI